MGTKTCGMCNGVGSMRGSHGPAKVCSGCNGRGYLHHDVPGEPDADDAVPSVPTGAPTNPGTVPGGGKQRPPRPAPKKERP